jgi:single-strand DNA-binding protein
VNRFYKNTAGEKVNEVSYFDIETYKTMADYCEKESEKGRGVRVKGRLKQNRWDSSDGKTNSRISIVAENIEFKTMLKNKTKELEAIKEATKSSISKEHEMELSEEDMLEAEF